MIRTLTAAGVLLAIAISFIHGSTLFTAVQGAADEAELAVPGAVDEAKLKALADVDLAAAIDGRSEGSVFEDAVLFLPGFGAPLEKQVRL